MARAKATIGREIDRPTMTASSSARKAEPPATLRMMVRTSTASLAAARPISSDLPAADERMVAAASVMALVLSRMSVASSLDRSSEAWAAA